MTKHAPKAVVDMVGTEEGDLTKEQAHALSEHIWNDEAKGESSSWRCRRRSRVVTTG